MPSPTSTLERPVFSNALQSQPLAPPSAPTLAPTPRVGLGRSPGEPLSCQREQFSLPAETHYLNCAYMGPLSRAVEGAGVRALQRGRYPAELPPAEYFRGPDAVRRAFAQLIHAERPERIALLPSVSYAMAIAARNVPVTRGQNVVVIGQEFPSAVLPWRRLARERALELRTVEAPKSATPGTDWSAELCRAIDSQTAAVVMSHVHWADGTRFDIAATAARARNVGAWVIMDGTQSVGALPLDVQQVHPDLLVCAGYKCLLGPYGLSVAYFGPRFDGGLPLEETWTSQAASEDFSRLADYRDQYRDDAARYDGGQRANFFLTPMLHAALEQLQTWDVARIQAYCVKLLEPWVDRAEEFGVSLASPEERASHLFGLRVQRPCDLGRLAEELLARQISVSIRGEVIRVSPNLYNDAGDMEALFTTLGDVLGMRKTT